MFVMNATKRKNKMAHEELKALYEIDKQNSDDPGKYWEFRAPSNFWVACCAPAFLSEVEYRRKPGAPVWPVNNDAEDARKWRELEAFYHGNGIMDAAKKFLEIIEPKPALIQGYTAEQWQAIIDGEFLCEFKNSEDEECVIINFLESFDEADSGEYQFFRPLRTKGVRQPWFGGERPINEGAHVHCSYKNGLTSTGFAGYVDWRIVVEFIEL